jgi:signal transduction histidine kinase
MAPRQIPLCMAILDWTGTLIGSNTDWENYADEFGFWRGQTSRGVDYLSILSQSSNGCAHKARIGVESLLAWFGVQQRRFQFSATSVRENDRSVVVITVSETAHAPRGSRLESLGLMTGGVASEFKELAVAANKNAESLRNCLSTTGDVVAISRSCRKMVRLANQLLQYGGRKAWRPEPTRLNDAVREGAELIETSVPKHVKLEFDLDETIPSVLGDYGQIQSMLINLIMNAVEGIADSGIVVVKTRSQHVDEDLTRDMKMSPPVKGDRVLLEIHDNGPEMDRRAMAEALELFPHKFKERPMLGVMAVVATIRGSGGALGIRSAPGQGTSFILFFRPAGDEDGEM